jgi:hypothetical protein
MNYITYGLPIQRRIQMPFVVNSAFIIKALLYFALTTVTLISLAQFNQNMPNSIRVGRNLVPQHYIDSLR